MKNNWLTILAENVGNEFKSDSKSFTIIDPDAKLAPKTRKVTLIKSNQSSSGSDVPGKFDISIQWSDSGNNFYTQSYVSSRDAEEEYERLSAALAELEKVSTENQTDKNDPKRKYDEAEAAKAAVAFFNKLKEKQKQPVVNMPSEPINTTQASYHGFDVEIINQNKFAIAFKYAGNFYVAPAESIILKGRDDANKNGTAVS